MMWIGVLVTLLGFVISLLSLGVSSAMGVRLALTLAGIAVSLFGIVGLINKAALRTAIWKRGTK